MLILASKSPRRRELIAKLRIPFTVSPADADEQLPDGIAPMDAVRMLAERKCAAGAAAHGEGDMVVGADTLVFLDGEPLGKPTDEQDALSMLMRLSGTTHSVCTGVAVSYRGKMLSAAEETLVTFRPYSRRTALWYVKTGEPMDKAGSYGIQGKGGRLVARVDGALDNVIGLPVALLGRLIEQHRKREKMAEVTARLKVSYPDATCALKYEGDPWRLLVMGRLSAQCTDARVNEVCKELFTKYPSAEEMAAADLGELCEAVRSCGLHRTKGRDLKEASRLLVEKYNGVLPDTMEELLTFPGVGRKIANLLLGDLFGKPAVVTDTHCIRICGRLGAYSESERDPYRIERILRDLLDPAESADFCHRIVHFGREVCSARAPRCACCPLSTLCDRYAKEHPVGE